MNPYSYRQPLSNVPYEFSYTPVFIRLVPSVVVEGGSSFDIDQAPSRIVIHSPSSRLPGAEQTLSKRTVVPIPPSGVIRLKLVPSCLYNPEGIYKVDVYSKGSRVVLDTMTWIVPRAAEPITIDLVRSNKDRDSIGAKDFYGLVEVSSSGDYVLEEGNIVWKSGGPNIGDKYSVTYQPAVTLDNLVVDRPQ